MKKTLLFILAVTALVLNSIAQVYVGDQVKEAKPESEQAQPRKHTSGSRYKSKYLHLGYFSPKMTPSAVYTEGPFQANTEPQYGFFFESGKNRFFDDNFIMGDKGNIGLYSGTSFGLVKYNFNMPSSFDGSTFPFLFFDIKYGPDFRYEINDDLKVDLYGNVGLLVSYGGYVQDADGIALYTPTKPVFAFQTGVGLDFSVRSFLIGTQLNFSKGKYKFDVLEEFNSEGGPYTETVSEDYDVLLNSFKVYIGFVFNK